MSLEFWCFVGLFVTVVFLWFALAAMCMMGGADAHIEMIPPKYLPEYGMVEVIADGVLIGRAEVLHRKGKYVTVRYESGAVGVVDTDYIDVEEVE